MKKIDKKQLVKRFSGQEQLPLFEACDLPEERHAMETMMGLHDKGDGFLRNSYEADYHGKH